jgi:beta-lactamase superfamily II metal-dependent hydrolase
MALVACNGARPPAAQPAPLPPVDTAPAMQAHVIDVGQGAATLVELPCGAALVDTGGESNAAFDSGESLRAHLETFFSRRADLNRKIDVLILTHPHLDHTKNVRMVIENFEVANVVTDGLSKGSGVKQQRWLEGWASEHAKLARIDTDAIPSGGATDSTIDPIRCQPIDPRIVALWGAVNVRPESWSEKDFANANNHSVVVRFDFGRASLLISGDLEEAGIDQLITKHRGTGVLDVDLWQVGHHGSYNGTTPAFLETMTPKVALISMGPAGRKGDWTAWRFGHPRIRAIEMLEQAVSTRRPATVVPIGVGVRQFEQRKIDKAIYATGWDGTIIVRATAQGDYTVMPRGR